MLALRHYRVSALQAGRVDQAPNPADLPQVGLLQRVARDAGLPAGEPVARDREDRDGRTYRVVSLRINLRRPRPGRQWRGLAWLLIRAGLTYHATLPDPA